MPTPEVKKSPEQIKVEAAMARERAAVDSTVAAAAAETGTVQSREAAMTKHAADKAKARTEAEAEAAGGVAGKKEKERPGVVKTAVTYGAAGGIAGVSVLSKVLNPAVEWVGGKLKSAWQWLDVWDLSGTKSAKKSDKKK